MQHERQARTVKQTVLQSPVVLKILEASWSSRTDPDIILIKQRSIEIFHGANERCLDLILSTPVFANVKDAAIITISQIEPDVKDEFSDGVITIKQDILAFVCDDGYLYFSDFNRERQLLRCRQKIKVGLEERTVDHLCHRIAVDSSNRAITLVARQDYMLTMGLKDPSDVGDVIEDVRVRLRLLTEGKTCSS